MAQVLVIEDDAILLRMYQKAFEIEGVAVDSAINGEEGLMKVKQNPPSLILLDIMMPKMSGFQFLDALRADPALGNVPVVVLTNLSSSEDTTLAVSKGAKEVVVKSQNDPMQVVAIAKKYLGQVPMGTQMPGA